MTAITKLPRAIIGHLKSLDRRLLLLAIVVAIAVVVAGLLYVGSIEWKSDQRKTYTTALFGAAGVGVVVSEIARQWKWFVGAALVVFTAGVVWVGLGVLVDELDLGRFSEGERVPTAVADQVPDPVAHDPVDAPVAQSTEDLESIRLATEVVAEGFDQPLDVIVSSIDGELLVAERGGLVRRVLQDGTVDDRPVVDMSDDILALDEHGLHAISLSPDDERIYLSWSTSRGDDDFSGVTSFEFDGEVADADTRIEVIEIPQPYERHNGGGMRFGDDGYLYIGVGDGGRLRDPHGTGQDRSNRLSTVLRILPTPDGDEPYLIPPDNPFVDEADIWPEIFVYGARNPYRITVDSATGDIWIGDVGQTEFEEINYLAYGDVSGPNHGWSIMEGEEVYPGTDFDPSGYTEADIPADHVPPLYAYAQDFDAPEGSRNSVTGGVVYRGSAIPELEGVYLFADFTAGWFGLLSYDRDSAEVLGYSQTLDLGVSASVSIGQDADGEILLVQFGGEILRVVSDA